MPGRHRMRSKIRRLSLSAVVLAIVAAGTWFGYQQLAPSTCAGEVSLTVAAAPEIAPAVRTVAQRWVAGGAAVDGVCVVVQVTDADPVDVAAVVAAKHGAVLSGVGQANGAVEAPDVWLPDSSTWLLRLKSGGAAAFDPTNGASVANSPVVLAMPEPVATRSGWLVKKPTWADLLGDITTKTKFRAGIVDPTRDAAGLSGLLSLAATAGKTSESDRQKATTAALRAIATGRSELRQDLLAKFPRAKDAASISSSLSVAPLSEKDVISYNAEQPAVPLTAIYLEPAPVALDYPYAVLPGIEPARTAAADGLFEALKTPEFVKLLAAQGLRAADGSWGEGFAAPAGAPKPVGNRPLAASAGLNPDMVDKVVSSWTLATQPGRLLAVIDVSGSMKQPVPTAGNATRTQVTVAAARAGLRLFDDSWAAGLWIFSTELGGGRDYRELAPIGPLSAQRDKLDQALARIVPKEGGDTGLYDTMLAAYRSVQEGWEAGRVNSIVMFTDGRNEDAKGISQQELLNKLKQLADPERPIQVVIIGIGSDINRSELDAIVKVTGGGVFVTEDPTKIGDIFLKAISLRQR